jgi:hypothetical protein
MAADHVVILHLKTEGGGSKDFESEPMGFAEASSFAAHKKRYGLSARVEKLSDEEIARRKKDRRERAKAEKKKRDEIKTRRLVP